MTPHLIAVEIGPVGEFLSASRKTRDLWYGSGLFSHVARAVARAVAGACGGPGCLIFPAPDATQLADPDFNVADEIWAEVPAEVPPADVAKAAKAAAVGEWARRAKEVADDKRFEHILRQDQWREQTAGTSDEFAGDVIECYAAWAPLGDYQQTRKRVKALLNGRTACRNFPPASGTDTGLPKSSLDGSRSTVLKKTEHDGTIRRLRLTQGEQLDAPGVVKRHGGTQAYPSVARIAADPWLRGAAKDKPVLFEAFRAACEEFAKRPHVTRLNEKEHPQLAAFPFEGALVYENRHTEFAEELAEYDDRDVPARRKAVQAFLTGPMATVRQTLKALVGAVGAPQAYYAVLNADGDKVGEALNAVSDPDKHRAFSRSLATFATDVRVIVERHSGAPVYAGGDDVLAFVPLDRAIKCGADLNKRFGEVWPGVTLSVGLAVAHFMEPLEDVLDAARKALDDAKVYDDTQGNKKNALAVRFQTRGGAPIRIVGGWKDGIAERLGKFVEAFNTKRLPSKAAYDLRGLANQYSDPNVWPANNATGDVIRADAARLLKRKGGDAKTILGELTAGVQSGAGLLKRADEVLVARGLAEAARHEGAK